MIQGLGYDPIEFPHETQKLRPGYGVESRMKWMLNKYRNSIWLLFNHKRIRPVHSFGRPLEEPFGNQDRPSPHILPYHSLHVLCAPM